MYIYGEMSEKEDVDSSVPQGSVLGPTLFTVYIDDLDDEAINIDVLKKFADDTKGAKKIKGPEDARKFQEGLDSLTEWGKKNSMEFNTKKCKIMHCGRNNPRNKYR